MNRPVLKTDVFNPFVHKNMVSPSRAKTLASPLPSYHQPQHPTFPFSLITYSISPYIALISSPSTHSSTPDPFPIQRSSTARRLYFVQSEHAPQRRNLPMTLQIVTCSMQLCVGTSFGLCQKCMKICIQHGVELDGPKLGMPIRVSVNFISYMDEGMIIKSWP